MFSVTISTTSRHDASTVLGVGCAVRPTELSSVSSDTRHRRPPLPSAQTGKRHHVWDLQCPERFLRMPHQRQHQQQQQELLGCPQQQSRPRCVPPDRPAWVTSPSLEPHSCQPSQISQTEWGPAVRLRSLPLITLLIPPPLTSLPTDPCHKGRGNPGTTTPTPPGRMTLWALCLQRKLQHPPYSRACPQHSLQHPPHSLPHPQHCLPCHPHTCSDPGEITYSCKRSSSVPLSTPSSRGWHRW